jgi:hypothetical protein
LTNSRTNLYGAKKQGDGVRHNRLNDKLMTPALKSKGRSHFVFVPEKSTKVLHGQRKEILRFQ